MRPRLVVIDLDETLVGRDLKISRANQRAIAAVQRQGTKVTIATGRTFTTTRPFAEKLGLDQPIICYQGAVVRTARRILRLRRLDPAFPRSLIRYGFHERTQIAVYTNEQVFFHKPLSHWGKEYLNQIEQVKEINLVDLRAYAFPSPILKVMYISNARKMVGLEARAKRRFGDDMAITRSRANLLEFTNRQASKGEALAYLARWLKIPLRRTMAIGDGYNDISMFRTAGFSVAVANAPAAVEAAADAVTESHYRDGVAMALEAFVLHRGKPLAS